MGVFVWYVGVFVCVSAHLSVFLYVSAHLSVYVGVLYV